ncbi:threonine/homoserine/homoserine lactone efflux protein [Tamaricihabitans halophyticus]|uniref:Threonine/homoserine/homoserine lactone efflux protein n=1 Tax=Tamaricihabitans halophyticus TaxID=1262583 RepID=A0A4R2QQM4_9PSEU|nr:LysE family translocator [Tamaricihabitans halophyticus]TCP49341.1 threonine/homoserine/homoserine lactone efflux protein [Tamaricihabitans halophyticus]
MSGSTLLAWTLVALLGVITPGIDTFLVLRHTLLSGRRAGMATVGGIGLGCAVWATASLAGLTALLVASRTAYDVVRIAGAAYLVWLGGIAIWKSLPRNQAPASGDAELTVLTPMRPMVAFRTGMVTNLLNPKVGVFYISILPQFMPTGAGATLWGMLLVTIHITATFAWLPLVIWTASKAKRWFLRQRVRAWLDRTTAAVLIGVGVKLAANTR